MNLITPEYEVERWYRTEHGYFGRHAAHYRCGGCKSASYCGKDCQKAHWKLTHKKDCGAFAKAKVTTPGILKPAFCRCYNPVFDWYASPCKSLSVDVCTRVQDTASVACNGDGKARELLSELQDQVAKLSIQDAMMEVGQGNL
jgi:hypothetical protein